MHVGVRGGERRLDESPATEEPPRGWGPFSSETLAGCLAQWNRIRVLPGSESLRKSRMREILTSGSMRGEATMLSIVPPLLYRP